MILPHHAAWLAAHPERTEEWLKARLRDGFHVHHVDGNHGNNQPENLVLIDGEDHFRIHGGRNSKLHYVGAVKHPERTRLRMERGAAAYRERAKGRKWGSRQGDYAAAKAYAERFGLQWPPVDLTAS